MGVWARAQMWIVCSGPAFQGEGADSMWHHQKTGLGLQEPSAERLPVFSASPYVSGAIGLSNVIILSVHACVLQFNFIILSLRSCATFSHWVQDFGHNTRTADYAQTGRRVMFIQVVSREVQGEQTHLSREACLLFLYVFVLYRSPPHQTHMFLMTFSSVLIWLPVRPQQ